MMRRPFSRRKQNTIAPTGHSTTAATAKAKNPSVGPKTLHRHRLPVDPHSIHIGIPIQAMEISNLIQN
ncbi:hypothetical protein RHMOL_Rhmol10G0098100 [Rhododendron molle]|uniref:Uncharacterized protein n=1 Tax=Rhododendron molle TaxID=49168 RepID=A0ACC0M2F1_RHOML|nr:hypothetical protein RHMOL_Rhmol10G0098100 [Rhododendron molle]